MGWPLRLSPKPSRLEATFRMACHLGTALVLVPLEEWWRFIAWFLIALNYWRYAPPEWEIEFDGERWWLKKSSRKGRPLPHQGRSEGSRRWQAELQRSSWRSPYVAVLHFRLRWTGKFVAVPIWRDSVGEDDFRRLLVVLKWWSPPKERSG